MDATGDSPRTGGRVGRRVGTALGSLGLQAARSLLHFPPVADVPEGGLLELPGRGTLFVADTGPVDTARGPAPTIFLLHGLACSGLLNWFPTIAHLRRRYRLVIMDQRWHGQGIRSPRFTLEDCADDVVAVADELGIDTFVPTGYSMGSLVSQLVWHRHRDRVAGLVLAASTTHFAATPRRQQAVLSVGRRIAWMATKQRRLAVAALDPALDDTWAWRQFRATTGREIATATSIIARFDSRPWIGGVDVPTAVVIPARDRLIPPARQRELARRISQATVYEMAAGHASCVMELDEFRPAMLAACSSVASRIASTA